MRMSFASIFTSTSSASGSTATVSPKYALAPASPLPEPAAPDARRSHTSSCEYTRPVDDRDHFLQSAHRRLASSTATSTFHRCFPQTARTCGTPPPQTAKPHRHRYPRESPAPRSSRRSDPSAAGAASGPLPAAAPPRLERCQLFLSHRPNLRVGLIQHRARIGNPRPSTCRYSRYFETTGSRSRCCLAIF